MKIQITKFLLMNACMTKEQGLWLSQISPLQDLAGYQIPDFPANGTWHEWTKDYGIQSDDNQLTVDQAEYSAQVFVWQ